MKIVRPDKLRTMKQTIKRIHYATAFYSETAVDSVEYYEQGTDAPTIISSNITTAGSFNSAVGSRNVLKIHGIVDQTEGLSADSALLVQKETLAVIYNGDLQSTDTWDTSTVAGWYLSTEGGESLASVTASEHHSGTQSLRLHVDDEDNYVKAGVSDALDVPNIIRLTPEGLYTFSFWHKSTEEGVLNLVLTMQQANGDTVYLQADGTWGETPNIAISTSDTWTKYTINFEAQDRVRLMQSPLMDLYLQTGNGSAGIDYFLDDVTLEPQVTNNADLAYFDRFILHRGEVTKVEKDEDAPSTTITIDDAIVVAASTPYGGLNLDYPVTIEGLINAIATSVITNGSAVYPDNLPNLDYSLESDAFANIQNYMVRDFIADIAEATGSTARITPQNQLEFTPLSMDPVDTLDHSTLSKLKVIATTGRVNQLSLSRQPQDDNIVETNEVSAVADGLTTYRIVNNWIMDPNRAAFIVNLFNDVYDGIEYYTGRAETIGLCAYDVGDVIVMDNGGDEYNMFINEIDLVLEGGSIKETLVSVPFDDGTTNQQTAGNVLTTLYNTKIQVDHQNNSITSLVAEYTSFANETTSQFTQVLQTLENITSTIQSTGGGNLIQNSVGFSREGTALSHWIESGTGTLSSQDAPSSLAYGAVSGHSIMLTGSSKKISQRVPVTLGGEYSFSVYASKTTAGNAHIRLSNSVDSYEFDLLSGQIYTWTFFYTEGIIASDVYFDIEIESDGASAFYITDPMLVTGVYRQVWSQFNGEILNTSVQIDTRGIRVYSDENVGSYTMMTPSEFASYDSNNEVAFRANNDTIEMNNMLVNGDTYYQNSRVFIRQDSDGLSYYIRDPA